MGEGRKGQNYWDTNFSSFSLPTFPFCCLLSYGCKHARTMSSSAQLLRLLSPTYTDRRRAALRAVPSLYVVDGEEVSSGVRSTSDLPKETSLVDDDVVRCRVKHFLAAS